LAGDDAGAPDSPQREISRGMVSIYKDYFGRGPSWAQTTLADTHVTTILSDALTVVEQRLADEGNHETVRSLRRKVQESMARDMSDLIERTTGRTVKCLLSDHDVPTDTAVEVVVFSGAESAPSGT
jgi:uncharacterized protein YbcI